jgi:hypothetical protein
LRKIRSQPGEKLAAERGTKLPSGAGTRKSRLRLRAGAGIKHPVVEYLENGSAGFDGCIFHFLPLSLNGDGAQLGLLLFLKCSIPRRLMGI